MKSNEAFEHLNSVTPRARKLLYKRHYNGNCKCYLKGADGSVRGSGRDCVWSCLKGADQQFFLSRISHESSRGLN